MRINLCKSSLDQGCLTVLELNIITLSVAQWLSYTQEFSIPKCLSYEDSVT
jgi:hypothetical protein